MQQEVQNKIQEATFFIENPIPAVTLAVREERMPYHVVAGAFRQQENAQKALNKLTSMGYEAQMLPRTRHGLYPVSYGSYSSYRMAMSAITKIKKEQNPDAWILIKETK